MAWEGVDYSARIAERAVNCAWWAKNLSTYFNIYARKRTAAIVKTNYEELLRCLGS